MGKASFLSREIPVTGEVREVINEDFTFNNKDYKATCLTIGNPHCIIFMDEVSEKAARELGPYVENADEFPERMNLQICRKIDTGNLDIEIWERGSGYTKASGTGRCAAAMAAYKLGLSIYAKDYAGNRSDVVKLDNPYYKEPAPEKKPATTAPGIHNYKNTAR